MTRYIDTNVLVRHVSGVPKDQAAAATALLANAAPRDLFLTDVGVAEFVWVLQSSIYQADVATIRSALEGILALPAIDVADPSVLRDALSIYAQRGLAWIDSYIIASARAAKVSDIVSFDRFDAKLQGLDVVRVDPMGES